MKNLEKNIISFGVIFIFIAVLIGFNFNITGRIIWEDVSVNNCSDASIATLWNSVFNESASDISIFKGIEANGNCDKYLAYKNNSDGELWVLYGEIFNNSWDSSYQYSDGKRILESSNATFLYFNTTNDFIATLEAENDLDSKIDLLYGLMYSDYSELANWSIQNTTALNASLNILYKSDVYSDISWDESTDYFYYLDTNSSDYDYFRFRFDFLKNKSLSSNVYSTRTYDPLFVVELLGDVDDFDFLKNSSWNFAFDLRDYFNFSDDISIIFDYVGENNTNGEWINYSIDGNNVSFMPKINFTGEREFRLVAINPAGSNVSSNDFNISITRYNNEPELIENIENIYLSSGETETIDLDLYFNDSDGDDLNYSVREDDVATLNVSINDNIMTVKLNNSFGEYEDFRVYASDGLETTRSNLIYVYESGANESVNASETGEEEDEEEDEEEEGSQIISSADSGEDDGYIDSLKKEADSDKSKTIVWVVVILIVLGIVGIFLIGMKLKKTGTKDSFKPSSVGALPVIGRPGPSVKPLVRTNVAPKGPLPNRNAASRGAIQNRNVPPRNTGFNPNSKRMSFQG